MQLLASPIPTNGGATLLDIYRYPKASARVKLEASLPSLEVDGGALQEF